jgi:hypothetical protein
VTNQFIGGTQSKKTNFEKIKRILMSCHHMVFLFCYGLPSILTFISEGGNVDMTKRFNIESLVAYMINKCLLILSKRATKFCAAELMIGLAKL